MRRLVVSRGAWIEPEDGLLRYRGSAAAIGEDLLLRVLNDLAVVKPLISWLPSGGVLRDQETAYSWAKWYCGFRDREFRDSHLDNFRHVMLLITDDRLRHLQFLSRLEPIVGEGSISFRAIVTRTAEDEYACFEY